MRTEEQVLKLLRGIRDNNDAGILNEYYAMAHEQALMWVLDLLPPRATRHLEAAAWGTNEERELATEAMREPGAILESILARELA